MQAARPKDTFCPTFNYRESLKGPLEDLVPQTHRLYPIVKKHPPLLLDLGFLARVYPEYAQSVEELGSRITAYRKVLPPQGRSHTAITVVIQAIPLLVLVLEMA